MNDGWDDDDDLDLDLTLDNDVNNDLTVTPPAQQQKPLATGGGWEEDEDLFGEVDDEEQQQAFVPTTAAPAAAAKASTGANGGGWEEDEDLFGEDDEDDNVENLQAPTPSPSPPPRDLLQELKDYVNSLSRMESSINAVLEYEYNTPEKAQELVQYYQARPGLAEYTRTREVPRMNYQVVLPAGHVETNKQTIAQQHLPDHSLLARSANQSLLADLLHVLTGPDLVVRPQFLAICVAQMCQFRLHIGDEGRGMVQVNCMLQLSLPTDGPRLQIATLRTTIVFSPLQPMIKFRVDKIVPMLKEKDYDKKLSAVVDFLEMMEDSHQLLPGHEDLELQNAPADIFRDVFLEQSQQILGQSKAGMKSALKDMESVIGLKSKFKALSKFLPDTSVLLAAEEEARALAAEREKQQQLAARAPPLPLPRPVVHQEPMAAVPRPPPPRPPGPQGVPQAPLSNEGSRPKSILGGLVSSGWSALAKSVAIPDEDPAIYGEAPPPQQQPMLYRKPEPPTPAEETPKLYHRPEPPPKPAALLYRQESPPPMAVPPSHPKPPPPAMQNATPLLVPAPKMHKTVPETPVAPLSPTKGDELESDENNFGDGWDDDLDDLEGDDDNDNVNDNVEEGDAQSEGATSQEEAIEQDKGEENEGSSSPLHTPTMFPPAVAPPSLLPMETAMAVPTLPITEVAPATTLKQPSATRAHGPPKRQLVANIPYNAQDDIIPTRKRWVNPRPNRSYLLSL